MILLESEIIRFWQLEWIKIDPFDKKYLGGNSYDVHLSKHLMVYKIPEVIGHLDCKKVNLTRSMNISEDGFVLEPNQLYLGSTIEYTESYNCVPFLEGKSSLGRLGLSIHVTAGKGDIGFCGHWTLEMSVIHPLRIYAGMPIGQLIYFATIGRTKKEYRVKSEAKYHNQGKYPVPSEMWRNFESSDSQRYDDVNATQKGADIPPTQGLMP